MIFRDWDLEIEKIAADWAGRVFADPNEFVDEDGKTLREVAAHALETGCRRSVLNYLGSFAYQGKFTCYAKMRPMAPTEKIVSDICFLAGLPVCPVILANHDSHVIGISLSPFDDPRNAYLDEAPEIGTVATVIDTLFRNPERKANDCCRPHFDETAQAGRIGLFDFDRGLSSLTSESEKRRICLPDDIEKSMLLPNWGFEAVKRLTAVSSEQCLEIYGRIPNEHRLDYIGELLERHRQLPEIFDGLFGAAKLAEALEPQRIYDQAMKRAQALKR